MSVIAYRDGVLAADTATTFGAYLIRRDLPKIVEQDGRLAAAAGDAAYCARFLEWFRSGAKPWDAPKQTEYPGYDGPDEAFIVERDKSLTIFGTRGCFPANGSRYHAIGSGAQFAMGAMHYGASAVEAVRAGMELDANSGGDITVLRLGA